MAQEALWNARQGTKYSLDPARLAEEGEERGIVITIRIYWSWLISTFIIDAIVAIGYASNGEAKTIAAVLLANLFMFAGAVMYEER